MRKIKLLSAIVFFLGMVSCGFVATSVKGSGSDQITVKEYENVLIAEVEKEISQAFGEFYYLGEIHSTADNSTIEGDIFRTRIHSSTDTVLKVDTVEELPFVQGMMAASGVVDGDFQENMVISTDAIRVDISEDQKQAAVVALEKKYEELQEYVGESTDMHLWLYVEAEIVNNDIDLSTINIMAENIDCLVPFEDILPKSSVEQKQEGMKAMQEVLDAPASRQAASSKGYPNYRRIAARDYALAFVG